MGLTDLQWNILNVMMDDYEDVEQVYLSINRDALMARGQPDHLLFVVVDEIRNLLASGHVKAEYTNDEGRTPVGNLNQELIFYYWIGPTDKGKQAWKDYRH